MPYSTHDTLWEAIQAVNAELRAGEPTRDDILNGFRGNLSRSDNDSHRAYEPQALLDAVNMHLGPENWQENIEIRDIEEPDRKSGEMKTHFEARVVISIWDDARQQWLTKGEGYGFGRADRNANDAKKAAISDGRKKAFLAWSIGNRPFLGLIQLPKDPHSNSIAGHRTTDQRSNTDLANAATRRQRERDGQLGESPEDEIDGELQREFYAALTRAKSANGILLFWDDAKKGWKPGPTARLREYLHWHKVLTREAYENGCLILQEIDKFPPAQDEWFPPRFIKKEQQL